MESRKKQQCAPKKPPNFTLRYKNGQLILEKEKQPPEPHATLLLGGAQFRYFKNNIRMYNCMFAMTSSRGKFD